MGENGLPDGATLGTALRQAREVLEASDAEMASGTYRRASQPSWPWRSGRWRRVRSCPPRSSGAG